ncbi:MAG: hypothetical protein WC659_03890 [Patescibacteria group bacterium]
MEGFRAIVGPLAGALAAFAIARYIWAIFQTMRLPSGQRVTPNRVTWGVISVIGWTFLANNVAMGATYTLWLPMVYAMGPTIVALISIRHGVGGRDKNDIVAGTIAVLSLILWWWLGLSAGFAANLMADIAAIYPTIRKAYRQPGTEDRTAWVCTTIGCVINLMAVPAPWSGVGAYAAYQVVANGTIAVLALRRKNVKNTS